MDKGRIRGKKVAWQDYALWKGYPLDLPWLLTSSLYIQKHNYKLPRALRMICRSPEGLELHCRLLLVNGDQFQGFLCDLVADGPSKGKQECSQYVLEGKGNTFQ